MSTERVDIVVSETGASTVKRSLDDLATSADKAGGSTSALQDEVRRAQQASSAFRGETERLSASFEKVVSAAANTAISDLREELTAAGVSARDAGKHTAAAMGDIRASLEETIREMREFGATDEQIKSSVWRETNQIRAGFKGFTDEIRAGLDEQNRSTGGLFSWRTEATATRRAASLLDSAFSGVVSSSSGMGAGIRLATTALIGGGGLILAIEGVRFATSIVSGAIDAFTKEQEEAKRAAEEHAKALRTLSTETRNYTDSLAGGPSQVLAMKAAMRALADEAAPLEEKLRALREEQEKAAIASAESGMDQGSGFAVDAEKAQKELDRLNDKRRASQNEYAQRIAAETDQQRLEAERRGSQLIAKQNEENRVAGEETAAMRRRYAAEEVRIEADAERQIRDLKQNTGLLTQKQLEARIAGIRSIAREEAARAREARAAGVFAAEQGFAALGASPDRQAWIQTETEMMRLATEYDQADRTHNAAQIARVSRLMAIESEAGSKRIAMAEAAMAAERAASLVAQERAQFVQSRSPEQAETEADKAAQAIREAEEITQRGRVARNLGASGGSLLYAERLTEMEAAFRKERSMLEQMAREQPALRAQIEIAQTDIVRREARARAQAELESQRERISDQYEFFSTLSALQSSSSREVAAVGKAAAVAQATIDGILAVQKALASSPPPWNYAIAAAVGATTAANVARIQGFESGGWTGYGPTGAVAGVTHGQEFVVRAGAAARNRGALEAMNRGEDLARYAGATAAAAPKITVHNYAGARVQVERLSRGEVAVMIHEAIEDRTPHIMEREQRDASSRFSRAQGEHTTAARRR